MPTSGPLIDQQGRVHEVLRLSVSGRCAQRSVDGAPESEGTVGHPSDILTMYELARVGAVARTLGIRSVRLSGGEPLLRRGLGRLVAQLKARGFPDLAMTTNGMTLEHHADKLAEAGLDRVNVRCDSLRPERFAAIGGGGELRTVLRGMDAAERAGLRPLKVNVVLVAGRNDDEILDFAHFARRTGREVRFIECTRLDGGRRWSLDSVVPAERILREIGRVFPLVPNVGSGREAAELHTFADGAEGAIGIVARVTRPFCGSCELLRVTADGMVRNGLFADQEMSLLPALRTGTDEEVAELIRRAVWATARTGSGRDEPVMRSPARSMSTIGG